MLESLEDRRLLSTGSPDLFFGSAGEVTTEFPARVAEGLNPTPQVAVQADGKIVTALTFEDATGQHRVFGAARYTSAGSLDPTFAGRGYVATDLGGTAVNVAGLAVQPDGKIVVSGQVDAGFGLVRYQSDGSLDPTFGNGGLITTVPSGSGQPIGGRVLLQPDGKLVVAGDTAGNGTRIVNVVRYTADGALDPTFGDGGVGRVDFDMRTMGAALQPDGKILVAGSVFDHSLPGLGLDGIGLVRFNADGTPDTGFGTNGTLHFTDVRGDETHAVALQPGGKIVVAAELDGAGRFAVVRLNGDGSTDTSFGNRGVAGVNVADGFGFAAALAVRPDGSLLLTGPVYDPSTNLYECALVFYTAAGGPDPNFGANGTALVSFAPLRVDASDLALQPDGKILVVGRGLDNGTGATSVALARYTADGISTPNQRYVAHLYAELLERVPDAGGLTNFSKLLDGGAASRADIARVLRGSLEYQVKTVQQLYVRHLQRQADPSGLGTWVDALGHGATAAEVEVALMGSTEYLQRRGGGTTAGFLTAAYRDLLGRDPDAPGLQSWNSALQGGTPPAAVAAAVLNSRESVILIVQGLFPRFLRRAADPSGLSSFTASLLAGTPVEAVVTALASSVEYFQRP
jgi:uncharacterized delta-60 repeat protein